MWRPHDAAIWVQYGHALKENGRLDDAYRAYLEALSIDPGEADTYLQIGHVLKLKKRIPDAIAFYKTALEHDATLKSAKLELRLVGTSEEEDRLESVESRIAALEPVIVSVGAQFSSLLEIQSNAKAVNFELLRCTRQVDELERQVEAVATQITTLEPVMVSVGAQFSSLPEIQSNAKAVNFELLRCAQRVDELERQLQAVVARDEPDHILARRLDGMEAQIAALEPIIVSVAENQSNAKAVNFELLRCTQRMNELERQVEGLSIQNRRDSGALSDEISKLTAHQERLGRDIAISTARIDALVKAFSAVAAKMATPFETDGLATKVTHLSEQLRDVASVVERLEKQQEDRQTEAQSRIESLSMDTKAMFELLSGRIESIPRNTVAEHRRRARGATNSVGITRPISND